MAKDPKSSSSLLPSTSSDNNQTKISLAGFIYVTIICGISIYRAHGVGNMPMVIFIIFVYFGTILLDYCVRLYHSLPRQEKSAQKRKLKISIWLLLNSILFAFACEFVTFMRPAVESVAFFALVIGGNSFLLYVYFIWNDGVQKSCDSEICSNSEGERKNRVIDMSGKGEEEENRALLEGSDNV